METRARPRSVVLTDWAAGVDHLRTDRSGFVNQILLLSLLYDEVLVQDELLVLSDPIANWFTTGDGSSLWSELLDVGSLVILQHPAAAYPTEQLQELSQSHPIEARSKYIERYGTKEDRPFKPSSAHLKFHAHIEWCLSQEKGRLRQAGAHRETQIMPLFVETLNSVLSNPHYSQWLTVCFPNLKPDDIARFRDFVGNPAKLVQELANAKIVGNVLRQNDKPVFNRSLAYLATNLFPIEKRGELKQVIQSSFAAPFCWQEDAVGRYGRNLRSIPNPTASDAGESINIGPLVEVQAHMNVPLAMPQPQPGFASVIAEVRDTKAGKALRESVATLAQSPSFDLQKECWSAVAHELAQRVVKPRHLGVSLDQVGHKLIEGVTVGALFHQVDSALAGEGDFLHALMAGAVAGGKHGIGGIVYDALHQVWNRSEDSVRVQELCFQFENAVDFQCTWLPEPELSGAVK